MYFRTQRLRKTWLVKCLKFHVLEQPSTVNMLNSLKDCTAALWPELSWKMSVLVTSSTLGVFVKTFTVDDQYSPCNRKNLPQQIQLSLSKKEKDFSEFFAAYLKTKSNFEHFEKKMTLIGYVFLKLETEKDVVS